jgi:hypothetical protein
VPFVADLHIHSYLSRATSRALDLEHLHAWAQRKGIAVVATGDFTHPRWFAELRDKLVPAGGGLFPAARRPGRRSRRRRASGGPRPGALPVVGRGQQHLQARRSGAQGAQPSLRARLRNRRAHRLAPGAHREHRIRRPAHPGTRFARPARNHPRIVARRVSDPGARVDAVVLRAWRKIGFRFPGRMLRRSGGPHLRRRNRVVVGSGHELAAVGARPGQPGVELGRPLAGKARPRGQPLRLRAVVLRHARRASRAQLQVSRHRRVLPRGGQVPPRRAIAPAT